MRERQKTARARQLRAAMTDAEQCLWRALRRHLLGARFRRQCPIGPYIADFASLHPKLVVEVDGGQHTTAVDHHRDAFLRARGFRILRFWNHDVLGNPEGVLDVILEALAVREIAEE